MCAVSMQAVDDNLRQVCRDNVELFSAPGIDTERNGNNTRFCKRCVVHGLKTPVRGVQMCSGCVSCSTARAALHVLVQGSFLLSFSSDVVATFRLRFIPRRTGSPVLRPPFPRTASRKVEISHRTELPSALCTVFKQKIEIMA